MSKQFSASNNKRGSASKSEGPAANPKKGGSGNFQKFFKDKKKGEQFRDEGRGKSFEESTERRFKNSDRNERGFNKRREDFSDRKREGDPSSKGAFYRGERNDNRPAKPKSDRPGKKGSYSAEGNRNERSFNRTDKNFQHDREDNRPARKPNAKPDKYAHTFGKFDDDELAAHQLKMKQKQEEREAGDNVSFSKSLERWEPEAVPTPAGRKGNRKAADKSNEKLEKRPRHNKQDKFKRRFDNENPYEKAYSAQPDGRPRKLNQEDEEYFEEVMQALPEKMPLNKYIAHCDVCSRRDAVSLIKEGKVEVNGTVVTEPGFKVAEGDTVVLNGKKLSVQRNLVYILLNKPKGYITTTDDPKGRRTVMDIVQHDLEERVFPIGRLDRNTTGLLLLTNDGDLAQKLSHPKYEIRKVYQVTTDKDVTLDDFNKIVEGVTLEDGPIKVDAIEYLNAKNELGLEIHSGKNRIVRRIFESLGYNVDKLDRVMYAGLTKKNLLRGKWRFLTKQEVINLKHLN
jgi:23S rRNA pseudouridine2605 synthase